MVILRGGSAAGDTGGSVTVTAPARPALHWRFLRYGACSAAAFAASAGALALVYHVLHLGPVAGSVAAFASGALVNFVGNRYWAWARRERRQLGRDALGYAVLSIGTALAATAATSIADRYTNRLELVEAAYFATYAAMFLVKFVLLDRVLFADRSRHQVESTTRA